MLTRSDVENQAWMGGQRDQVLALIGRCEGLLGIAVALREVLAVLDSPPHTCPVCRLEVGAAQGWKHADGCMVAKALEHSDGLAAAHDERVIREHEAKLAKVLRGGLVAPEKDVGVSVELADAMGAFLAKATQAIADERDLARAKVAVLEKTRMRPVGESPRTQLHAAAETWLASMLAEAAECLSYDAKHALASAPEAVEQLRARLQAWRDDLDTAPLVVSRSLVEEALVALNGHVAELVDVKPAPGIARAQLMLQEALG